LRFIIAAMDGRLPLSTLLSQTLVAFIVEFDNEFEHRTPHRTGLLGATGGRFVPWLVSMAFLVKVLRYVDEDGTTFDELKRRTGLKAQHLNAWLTRLSAWWGYLMVGPGLPWNSKRLPSPGLIFRPTPGGLKAILESRPLEGIVEKRWVRRFGLEEVSRLREALAEVAGQVAAGLPDSMPILGFGLFSAGPDGEAALGPAGDEAPISEMGLAGLLSKVLLAFAVEFERVSAVSLAVCANVLRLTPDEGIRLRDLPRLSGVSKESIGMALTFLEARGFAQVGKETGGKSKWLRLTELGVRARERYPILAGEIEERWRGALGADVIEALREPLERLVGAYDGPWTGLFEGMKPYPDGWRSHVPVPEALPHFPMILHRGGYPDGS
jgi:hypothetical protein